ncbi:CLUMA_CG019567, isoform A [Clunio marinus]|uniref:Adenosine deaminase n=1 Tax=Clunio marinus TaxID=568069 RepID=A0A1J1J304_9DIPT|nr:CLUMA_CG019567, isoform A [Clunio marinus]
MLSHRIILFSVILSSVQCYQTGNRSDMEASSRPSFIKYEAIRSEMLARHLGRALGSDIVLNEKEEQFNSILMDLKTDELMRGFQNPYNFTPSRHFFEVLNAMESSPLFKLMRKMPKGSTDYVVSLTRWDNLWQWGGIEDDELPKFVFSNKKPTSIDDVEWRLVGEIRKEMGDEAYDVKIRRLFTLIVNDPLIRYSDINSVWSKFNEIFMVFGSIVTYTEVWKDYFRQALQEIYDDGVQYLEFRGVLPETYDLEGNKYGPIETCGMYVDVLKEFNENHPDFGGAKFIYAPIRKVDDDTFESYLAIMQKLLKTFPDFIAGFDLVGQEDRGRPLIEYAERLLKYPENIKFFFHAAETNWLGTTSDENLIDAVLLGTKRIGHGYGIVKYPNLLKVVKEKKIGIEINPISNQVLKLVDDLRNHPATILFSDDYPVVISSDDPSFWGALPLTHDFYLAFLGIASAKQDLKCIKKLILNSFDLSALDERQKSRAKEIWMKKWTSFIEDALRDQKSTILIESK